MRSKAKKAEGGRFGGCFLVGFFLLFAAAGTAMAYWMTWKPVSGLVAAQGWVAAECKILTSHVETSSSDDSDTYSIAITYEYDYGGVTYQGDRYNFSFGSSSGYEGKARVVADYPPGTVAECFVDPDDPATSVINRSPGLYLLWSLFPLPFLLVGYGGLVGTLLFGGKSGDARKALPGRRAEPQRHEPGRREPSPAVAGGQLALEPKHTPLAKLVGVTIVALFWNGIVGVFLYFLLQEYRDGDGDAGCGLLFLIPFVLVGLGLIVAIFYQLLALANPRPHLLLDTGLLMPGTECSVRFWWTGSASRLDEMTIRLEGREAATYRRGTTTTTDHETFFEEVLLNEKNPTGRERSLTLKVPERTMPTFEAPNNKIEWRITVHGDIPRWPDVSEEFPVTVSPGTGGMG